VPIDAHLMVNEVDRIGLDYAHAGAASVTIHIEASQKPSATLQGIRKIGARAGLALKPGTEIEEYSDLLSDIDMLLINDG